jgi:hypothetical protein
MSSRKILEYGGFVAGAVLIVFGAVAIWMGANAYSTVRDSLKDEQIFFGDTQDPAVAKYASQWAGEQVKTGEQARAFAQVMRYHTMNGEWNPQHLTYAQMGRFLDKADPGNPKGTSDEAAALKDEKGAPVANSLRNTWVTETALTTALNVSYMAENLAVFGLVVGAALLLSGIGFVILAWFALGKAYKKEEAPALTPTPVAG